jgi:hypothetical protein
MEQLKQLQQLLAQQTAELAQYAASDPETVAAMEQATQVGGCWVAAPAACCCSRALPAHS